MNRRKFLVSAALTSGAIFAPALFQNCAKITDSQSEPDPNFIPDVELNIESVSSSVQILSGNATEVYTYVGELIKGKPENLQNIEGSYLGPIIRVKKGQKVRINYKNSINEESIIHWHGLHVPETADGHPRFVIDNGETYIYEFEVKNRAGTYWFHPHPHGKTGAQVYNGLAGLFIVTDDEEESLGLPSEEFDIPIVIQDRMFDDKNQFDYRFNRMEGFLGDTILINGKVNTELELSSRTYRLRLLNGSNTRIYKISVSDGSSLTVIGNDGGLLESPVIKNYLVLGPAERLDIIIDLSGKKPGDTLILKSLAFPDPNSDFGMMGRNPVSGSQNGAQFDLFRINITKSEDVPFSLPEKLSLIKQVDPGEIVNADNPRSFFFSMRMMTWTINGRTFEMTETASNEEVNINTSEVWEFRNEGMGGGSGMPHPVHIHGLQFQITEKIHEDSLLWESLKDGFVDSGWRDTFLLLPGMSVKVVMRFEDFKGLFLYHCHNLEHEDMGMMRNYKVL